MLKCHVRQFDKWFTNNTWRPSCYTSKSYILVTKILAQGLSIDKYSNAMSGSLINDSQTIHGDHHVTHLNLIYYSNQDSCTRALKWQVLKCHVRQFDKWFTSNTWRPSCYTSKSCILVTKILAQELSSDKYSNAMSGSLINDSQTIHGDHHVTRLNLIYYSNQDSCTRALKWQVLKCHVRQFDKWFTNNTCRPSCYTSKSYILVTKILAQELSSDKYSNAMSGSLINDSQTIHGDHHVTCLNLIY